jgi:hypothetical protein
MQAQIQVFLHIAGIQHRDHAGRKNMVGLMRQGRRVGAMVITGHQQDAAMSGGTGMVHVFEHIAAAIHARAFAIPHRKHAIVFGGPIRSTSGCPRRQLQPDLHSHPGELYVILF